ncbi:smad nuclear interacting protein 1 [Exaiptasia diaphana]|uniref:FHA domain-containing protein n=1 Tax=Exaiptasia diaphana TaxID=2652724 RepID=A0A913YNW1_EXADI|nr:smad nuclear interacting protein 1 [Exaiptasia diaphana]
MFYCINYYLVSIDRRRQREEEEPDDTSRYGQSVDAQENNTDAAGAEEPNFGLSGKLTEYTNTYKGVVIKYNEPPEARKPKTRWRLYPFKGEEALKVLYIHRQSAFLLGRQRHIADIPIDHPSCSKQHAVLQYKLADYERTDGTIGRKVKPYIIDLESANGTYLNNERIEPRRYYELKERDVLKFGFSSREYVMLHERSLNTEENQEEPTSSNEDSPE